MLVCPLHSPSLLLHFGLFLLLGSQVAPRPVVDQKEKANFDILIDIFNITDESESVIGKRDAENETIEERRETRKEKLIDPSTFITLKENDWRDAHEGRMIIWSHESQHHPDYGKTFTDRRQTYSYRQSKSSQLMSFCILGSVIGFILYTYFSHVIMMRKLNREREATRLRELVHRSALIMAGSAHQNEYDFSERRHSLINMFKAFKL